MQSAAEKTAPSKDWLKQRIESRKKMKALKEAKLLEKLEKRKASEEAQASREKENAVTFPMKKKAQKAKKKQQKEAVQPAANGTSTTESSASKPEEKKLSKEEKKLLKKQKAAEARQNLDPSTVTEKTKQKILRRLGEAEKKFRLSIAVPGSILDNAQSQELRTYLAGQIGRAAAIFKVDEVIVYDDKPVASEDGDEDEAAGRQSAGVHLSRILQYLECPQYLRRALFPVHSDLKYAGLLNPLDAPHHLRRDEVSPYREGVATSKTCEDGTLIDVGLVKPVRVAMKILPGTRVTVALDETCKPTVGGGTGRLVGPRTPKEVAGIYWGYEVRYEEGGLSKVLKSPGGPNEKYSVIIGTSERGSDVASLDLTRSPVTAGDDASRLPHRVLIVFGGLEGLETACRNDPKLLRLLEKRKRKLTGGTDADAADVPKGTRDDGPNGVVTSMEVDPELLCGNSVEPNQIFDHYVNTCTEQGSRTIRTEEALFISLTAIVPRFSAIFRNWERWI